MSSVLNFSIEFFELRFRDIPGYEINYLGKPVWTILERASSGFEFIKIVSHLYPTCKVNFCMYSDLKFQFPSLFVLFLI